MLTFSTHHTLQWEMIKKIGKLAVSFRCLPPCTLFALIFTIIFETCHANILQNTTLAEKISLINIVFKTESTTTVLKSGLFTGLVIWSYP